MIWSKLKKTIEGLLADSVKEHLQIYLTRYGSGESYIMNRAWLTWDSQEISAFSTIRFMNALKPLAAELSGDGELRVHYEYFQQAEALLEQRGIYPVERWLAALELYTTLSIEEACSSTNLLIKAWTLFDRRLGKRRLRAIPIAQLDPHYGLPWYRLRCQSEDLHIVIPPANPKKGG